ncbi:class II aldolase/adducin family protein, partial [Enterobacter bugandensis]|uniref:class II aldolase/adducin family protein n=1 Tax=Enterobacter bugandensis TaxID=881260 RepID=UPI0016813705
MTDDELRRAVLDANLDTVRHGLVISTFGNASGIDRNAGRLLIKPSGVAYDRLTPADMVPCDLDGRSLDNRLRPS